MFTIFACQYHQMEIVGVYLVGFFFYSEAFYLITYPFPKLQYCINPADMQCTLTLGNS